jgi:hypothetical protein
MALNYRLRDRGISPLILGPEQAGGVERDANRVHLRSATLAEQVVRRSPHLRAAYEYTMAELKGMLQDTDPLLFAPIQKRNVLFYLLPLRNPANVWQWHVEQLRKYLPLFNGRRIVTIATQDGDGPLCLESPAAVRAAFGADAASIEFVERPNDPNRWEGPAFTNMLSLVENLSPDEASFYFHAKGVRRLRQAAIRPWCDALYRYNLGHFEDAMRALRRAKACGAIRRDGDPTQARQQGAWHFSGTAFWFRHDTLFSRDDWCELSEHSHAVEAYLSTRFAREECVCLADDDGGYVYDPATWRRDRSRETTISVLVTARNYGRYLRDCLESCFWQIHKATEVLYVDDASEDDSVEIARGFEPLGLRILHRASSNGVEAARNFAAANASGDAILFVDGDNILPVDYLRTMVAALNCETPFVYPDLLEFGSGAQYHRMPEFRDADLWKGNFADTCSLMWRDLFEAAGGWIPIAGSHMEDWHLFLRMSHFGEPRRAGIGLCYRRHGNSRTNRLTCIQTPEEAAAIHEQVVNSVRQWSIGSFGRLLNEHERRRGVLGICKREAM